MSGINEDDERGSASSTANAVVDDISATTTPNGVPAAPTGVKAVAVNGTDVEIYWTAPTNYGGAPVTDYIVEWSANGTSGWAAITGRTASKATHQVQTGLTAGDTRHYRVRAVNAVSDAGGVASDPPVKVTTPDGTRPVAPTLTATANSSTSITLSWTRPAGTITGYVVEYTEKENTAGDAAALPWKELTRTSSLTANHPGLKPETKRWYRVAAINSKGRGVASDPVSETTDVLPAGPTISGMTAVDYEENGTEAVATYEVMGLEDGATARWDVSGTDADDFNISSGGALSFKTPPDFENAADADTNNVYEVTVEAGDGTNTGSLNVRVTVTDQDPEAPADDRPQAVQDYDTDETLGINASELSVAITDYLNDVLDPIGLSEVIAAYING